MRNEILLIGLIPIISAIPQLSYSHTAAHREENGLMGNFTDSSEHEEVSSHQSNSKIQAVIADNGAASQIASLSMPNGAGVIPSQATTELQMKMQKAFQDFANAIAQIASDAQIQASQLTVNPQAFSPPAINASPQPVPQLEAQPQAQAQPEANTQPSNEPSTQPSQEESQQQEAEAPAPVEENSEQQIPAASTRSLLGDLMANMDDSGSEVSSSDNYQFQFQSSPLPQYNPVYVKYDYPTAYDVSSLPAYSYYAPTYPAASYSGYPDSSAYHSLSHLKPSTNVLSASSVKQHQKLTSASTKPKAKELASASTAHNSQEIKSSTSSLSSTSNHQQQLSAASTSPKTQQMPAKLNASKQSTIQASSIHPQQASPLVQELQVKASQQLSIPAQSAQPLSQSSASTSPSQLDKVLTQIETESAPMLKRRERFNNMADHRVIIKDKFSEGFKRYSI